MGEVHLFGTFVDFSLGDLLLEAAQQIAEELEDEESIVRVDHSELDESTPVVTIRGNSATWTKTYTINSTTTTQDEQVLTGTYSCIIEVGLVKDTEWKINGLQIDLIVDETVPEGTALGLIFGMR